MTLRPRLVEIAIGLVLVAVVTAVLLPFRGGMSRAIPALAFVLPVVAAALIGRRTAALVTALAAAAVFSFSFVPPYDRVSIASAEDWAAFGVFLAVALVVGTLVGSEAERRRAAEERADEIRRLLAERDRLQEEANRVAVMEMIDQQRAALLRSVSHDLRTPLSTIRAVASDLRDGTDYTRETRDELLDLVGDEAERLNRLVGNLLSMSRIESGSLQPDRQALAVDELVDDRVHKLSRVLRHVDVSRDIPPGLPLVDADYVQLDQVITNLLENAARHAPPRSTVRIAARVVDDCVELSVQDEGDGIPEGHRTHVFEPFWSGSGSASSGVGLAICKAIVEAHGGGIGFESGSGRGTRFWFTLPVRPD